MKIPTRKSNQDELQSVIEGSIEQFKKLTTLYPRQLPLDMARHIKINLNKYYNENIVMFDMKHRVI